MGHDEGRKKIWTEIRHSLSQDDFYKRVSRYKLPLSRMITLGFPHKNNNGQVVFEYTEYTKRNVPTKHSPLGNHSSTSPAKSVAPKQTRFNKICSRCGKEFVIPPGENGSADKCKHHWGKLVVQYDRCHYSCCNKWCGAEECSIANSHVWYGLIPGTNIIHDSICTEPSANPKNNVFALDTEMLYTKAGLEICKISVVDYKGLIAYESFIKPHNPIVDYNTNYSGVVAEDLLNYKRLEEVHQDLLKFIDASTILIGHSLDHDLQVLKLVHYNCIDTSIVFPHKRGGPLRSSLKWLVQYHLGRTIQEGVGGHCSAEDARACMELMLRRA